MLNDTIVAISTGLNNNAISIIRMSGKDSINIINKIFNKDLGSVNSHTIHYGYIYDNEEVIDEVLVNVFRAPKTFTREDVIEINAHGGIYTTKYILSLLIKNGARLANPGEFTQRAYLNGRIDLTQAEAINDLINAGSDSDRKLAIQGMRGSIQDIIDPFIKDILDIIANIEVNIDYPEYEDIEELTNDKLLPLVNTWLNRMDVILSKARSGKLVKEGIKTAIVGKPNAGKSSLLNALLEEDKAIVSNIEGTTRDIVEGYIVLNDLKLNLLDTAGIRDSDNEIEKIGIQRSIKAIEDADLILLVIDSTKGMLDDDLILMDMAKDKNLIVVYNKCDLVQSLDNDKIYIDAKNGDIDRLLDKIHSLFDEHMFVLKEPTLNNERHIGLLMKAKQAMLRAKVSLDNLVEVDLVEIDIQEAYSALKEISGIVSRDDLLDTLFTNFCLGK